MPLSIFREYILQLNNFPTAIINTETTNFDFILGFASENGNGQFDLNWNDAGLSTEKVKELKQAYPNVRVVISIGGDKSVFHPILPRDRWVANALSSIEAIIRKYDKKIDGIDIHYDDIRSSSDDFALYIGDVIQKLKEKLPIIKVVSIAPTENVQGHYLNLYSQNKNNIDLVDYRFYNQQFTTEHDFIDSYNAVVDAFNDVAPGKVLAGISIPQNTTIFGGIQDLIRNKLMSGVFVWNADRSLENQLQKL